jgi:hypothetical protein
MKKDNMLDDGKTKAGAAQLAGPRFVHDIKSFEHAVLVFRDPDWNRRPLRLRRLGFSNDLNAPFLYI